jgi:hypothetical protein
MNAVDMVVRSALRQPIPPFGVAANRLVPCDFCGAETAEPFRNITPLACPTCRIKQQAGL